MCFLNKPTSVKFPKEMLADIDNECEGLGCNRTDFIKEAVQEKLYGKAQEQEEPKKPQLIKVEDVIEFECKNGNLYENGSLVGPCSNYNLDHGKVYEKNGKYLGQIQHDPNKPRQVIEI